MLEHCSAHEIFHHNAHPIPQAPSRCPPAGVESPENRRPRTISPTPLRPLPLLPEEVSVNVRRQPAGIGSVQIRRSIAPNKR